MQRSSTLPNPHRKPVTSLFCCVALLVVCTTASTAFAQPAPQTFRHPGVLNSQAELDAIRKRVAVAAADDPVFAGYVHTMTTRFADETYRPQSAARLKRGDAKPDDSLNRLRTSGLTAYTLALKWAATGDTSARDAAIRIVNAWAEVVVACEPDTPKAADASWALLPWCAAGELLERGKVAGQGSGWPADRASRLKSMIRLLSDASRPLFDPRLAATGNQASAALGGMAAGVYLDDGNLYAEARNYLLKQMPRLLTKAGYGNEIYLDPWQGTAGLAAIVQAAEVGRQQGDVSLFHAEYDGQDEPRILVSLKWYADPLRGMAVDVPPMGGPKYQPRPWRFVAAANTARTTGGWEIGLNYYKFIEKRPGLDELEDAVKKTYRPSDQQTTTSVQSDSLTHGELYKPGAILPVAR